MLDEHGMPVPTYAHGPFRVIPNDETAHDEAFLIVDGESNVINPIWQKDVGEFFAHASNWIIPCREIVRRLAELNNATVVCSQAIITLMDDAAKLWAKMQEDAKGAGDGVQD